MANNKFMTNLNVQRYIKLYAYTLLQMLSKMAKPTNLTIIDAYNVISATDLSKSKLTELKGFAKDLHIKVGGNKDVLLERIQEFLIKMRNAIKIQRNYRTHMANTWIKLKGSYDECVNDSDFYTLEPLKEIPFVYYIQHTDASNYKYGFNITSLCTLAKKNTTKLENPYNRENLKISFEQKLARVLRLTNILFPNCELMREISEGINNVSANVSSGNGSSANVSSATASSANALAPANAAISPHERAVLDKLNNLQQMSYHQRMVELFMHIDSLGNYTQIPWLTGLCSQRLYYLIYKTGRLWRNLPRDLRLRICPYVSPFGTAILGTMHLDGNTDAAEITKIVIRMAEVLVYSGVDAEHQNLGAMYFLSGLTIVSLDARAQLPWLYENYFTIVPS